MITPNEQYTRLGAALGYKDLYFKREDLHPLGSHKGRSIPVMIDYHFARGSKNFVITSSGNAALAAALYIKDMPDISLEIFVGENIVPHKLAKLAKIVEDTNKAENVKNDGNEKVLPERIKITKVPRPSQALMQATQRGMTSLRQSTDDIALVGYETLAKELLTMTKLAAVFIGTSSGTTAQALAQFFLKDKRGVQVHIVQTSSCHSMSESFHRCELSGTDNVGNPENMSEAKISIADAIVDKVALRKTALIPLIKQTGGSGWCATNEDIIAAQKLAKTYTGLDISTNSALSVVGALKAGRAKHNIEGPIACMICGD